MQGTILHTETTPDKLSCWSLCKSNDHCAWFSYGNIGNDCILLESCPDIEENQHFISGEKNCQYRQGKGYLYIVNSLEYMKYISKNYASRL